MRNNVILTRTIWIGKNVSPTISQDALLKKVKYIKLRDLIHLASIRGVILNNLSLEIILDALFKAIHKKKLKHLKNELYRNIQKRKNNQIVNELKKIRRLTHSTLVKKENISQSKFNEVKRLSDFSTKILRKLAQLRNVETTGLKRSDLIYILLRT